MPRARRSACCPSWGPCVIDSTPPATTTSFEPVAIDAGGQGDRLQAARAEAVDRAAPLVSMGSPPRKPTTRATLSPCSPSGHGAAEDEVLDVRRLHLRHAREQRRERPAPPARPAASARATPCARGLPPSALHLRRRCQPWCLRSCRSVPQGLVVHQHVLHALLALRLAAEADEGLALELEHLVLGHLVRGAAHAAAEDARRA